MEELESNSPPINTPRPAYPTIKQGMGLFGITVLLQIGAALLLGSLIAKNPSLGMLIVYVLVMGLSILFAWKMSERSTFSAGPFPLKLLPWVILLTPTIALLMEPLIEALPYAAEFNEMMLQAIGDNTTLAFLTVAVAAPLLEEVLFRGIVLDGFLKNYNPTKAIVWSAVIFGLVHLNPYQFIPAFLIGLIMGWIYWKTGSLWLCILIHFINNSAGFVLSWLVDSPLKEVQSTREMMSESGQYGMLLAGSAIILVFSLFMLHKGMEEKIVV